MIIEKPDEKGNTFIWICALCTIAMMAAIGLVHLGSATINRTRAQNAADAAALSAAFEIAHSHDDQACSSARTTAKRNNAVVTQCNVSYDDVVVSVQMLDDSNAAATARAEIQ